MDGRINFPTQKRLLKEKTEEWKRECVDSVVAYCTASSSYRRSPDHMKRRNYRLFNNKIDLKDFEHVTNPFGIRSKPGQFAFPATLQPYDIISPIFKLLLGEEAKRIYNPVVRAINEDSISTKEKQKAELIMSFLEESLTGADGEFTDPAQIDKYMTYTYQDMREKIANDLIQYYRKYFDLTNIWQMGFKDALISSEELYCIDIVAGEPRVQRVNPLELDFELATGSDYLDDAEKILWKTRMTTSEIIDEFYEVLTPAEINRLEEEGETDVVTIGQITVPMVESIYHMMDDTTDVRGHEVCRVKWKSMKKQGVWHYLDPATGEEREQLVDEDFKVDKSDPTQWIEWFWINEFWEGVRIKGDIYKNMRPCRHQFRSMMNYSECKSGFVGTIYDATNAQASSVMDRLVPWIYLYLIIWYRTELLMAANMGKIALIDLSLVPDDWEIEKWLYYANAMKIGFVNSYNEGNQKTRTGTPNISAQNKQLDLELGNSIQHHIATLRFIEEKIEDTSGVTKQRLGSIATSELVGNTERAVIQSSHITEELFRVHSNVKTRVLTTLVEVAKEAFMGMQKKMQYVTDDLATVFFTIEGDEFSNADYGVFTSDSSKDNEALNAIKQLTETAINAGNIQMSQIIEMYTTDSIAGLKNKLKQSEAQKAEAEQAQAERANQLQEQAQIRDDYNKEADRQVKIQVATIQAMGFAEDKDMDQNQVPDVLDLEKLELEKRKQAFTEYQATQQNSQDQQREARENKKLNADIELKKEKLKIDRKKASQKPKTSKK